ncbi:hypothetical protein E2C01_035994 [Portunus trituberculatus]|uniref:Uncharacterized protein n=1 Tax=Portunus trituberculatus TaxID=210409 RepID=A0A5B7FCZ4_PORTR|nr:hypothetical protein [Portunus trituberculatus]
MPPHGLPPLSFQPTGAQCHMTSLWHRKPTAFCVRVDRLTLAPSFMAAMLPLAHLMHSDSCLLRGDLLFDRGDGRVSSPGPDSALLGLEKQDWPPLGPKGG